MDGRVVQDGESSATGAGRGGGAGDECRKWKTESGQTYLAEGVSRCCGVGGSLSKRKKREATTVDF